MNESSRFIWFCLRLDVGRHGRVDSVDDCKKKQRLYTCLYRKKVESKQGKQNGYVHIRLMIGQQLLFSSLSCALISVITVHNATGL